MDDKFETLIERENSPMTMRTPPSTTGIRTPPRDLGFPTVNGSGSVLKRKRPARIDIPMMDALSFTPAGSDGRKEVEIESVRCSVYCKRGRKRVEMVDRFKVDLDLDGDAQLAFFGIFYGHGGTKAAEFASKNVGKNIVAEAMKEDGNVEAAVANRYLKTDSDFLKGGTLGGTCCVTAFVKKGDLIVANAGDCHAILSKKPKLDDDILPLGFLDPLPPEDLPEVVIAPPISVLPPPLPSPQVMPVLRSCKQFWKAGDYDGQPSYDLNTAMV